MASDIPFHYENGLIWLKVAVAGHDQPLDFLLDSGASVTVIDLQTARALGLKLGGAQSVQGVNARGTAYRVSGFEARAGENWLPAAPLAIDLSLIRAGGRKIGGLLGADFFWNRVLSVDFAGSRVRLLAPGEVVSAGQVVLPVCRRNDAICVRAAVGNCPSAWMRVDTGCNSAVEFAPGSAGVPGLAGASVGLSTGQVRDTQSGVQLGPERLGDVRVGVHEKPIFSGESGLLGTKLLARFKSVTFDMVSNRLILAGKQ